MSKIRIKDFGEFEVPAPYKAGHQLTETEADVLNQTFRENVRNNVAAKVAEMAKAGEPAEAIEAFVTEYAKTYEFGKRTGGGRTVDPVERIAKEIATEHILQQLADQGIRKSKIPAKELRAKVAEVFEANRDKLMAEAKKVVKAREAATKSISL